MKHGRELAAPASINCESARNDDWELSPLVGVDVAQNPAALRDRLDEFGAARSVAQFLAKLGDEDVDDLGLRLVVGATVKVLQQHRASDDIVARESEQLEHAIFHLGDADRVAVDSDQPMNLVVAVAAAAQGLRHLTAAEIGRASCRERV